ncbi:plasmid mobilization protein [Tepidicaulis sp. LMO-SS28]|uniref:plasmid mobilization protein n=1 Tax=Tepidicaulis sp. LMO-SS28 TaxID=3447455 RepID=UPI003EDEE8DA
MATNRKCIKTYFTDEETAHLDEVADRLRLRRSDFLRRLVMAYRVPDPMEFVAWQGIRDLLKVNADLARLGNLFKLALDEEPPETLMERLDGLAAEIAETQKELKAAALEIRALVQGRRA